MTALYCTASQWLRWVHQKEQHNELNCMKLWQIGNSHAKFPAWQIDRILQPISVNNHFQPDEVKIPHGTPHEWIPTLRNHKSLTWLPRSAHLRRPKKKTFFSSCHHQSVWTLYILANCCYKMAFMCAICFWLACKVTLRRICGGTYKGLEDFLQNWKGFPILLSRHRKNMGDCCHM